MAVAEASGTSTLTVVMNGAGSLSASRTLSGTPTNGATLTNGNTYVITAIPDANYMIKNWTTTAAGVTTIESTNLRCLFVMQPNLVVTANIVTNKFLDYTGTYYGLFQSLSQVQPAELSAGYFKITVVGVPNRPARFSGTLVFDNRSVGCSGAFDADGNASPTKFTVNDQTLTLALHLNFDDTIGGTITSSAGWTAELDGDRSVYTSGAPYSGNYTMLMYPTTGITGFGCAAFNIDTGKGLVSPYLHNAFGYFGDGEKLTPLPTPVAKSGRWPMFARKTKPGTGAVMGWVQFDGAAGIVGYESTLSWIKASGSQLVGVEGSGYNGAGINMTDATALLGGGNLGSAQNEAAIFGGSSIFVNPLTTLGYRNKMKLTLDVATGMVTGTFVNPAIAAKLTQIRAVYLQNQNFLGGYFLGPTASGSFLMEGN